MATKQAANYNSRGPWGSLPLSFEANQGQADSQVRFLSRGSGYSLLLSDSAAVLTLSNPGFAGGKAGATSWNWTHPKTDVIRMEFAGARRSPNVAGKDQLPGKINYFIDSDPAKWHANIPTYAKVKYAGIYPGVDLVYYGNQRQLEYDFVVAPGASSKPIRLHFAGDGKVKLNGKGDLTLAAKNGEIVFQKPAVYQVRDGRREPVKGRFMLLAENSVGFSVGDYDHGRQLVIDPVLAFSTGIDGTPHALTVDNDGYVYVAAQSFVSVPPPAYFSSFVSKINPAGSALVYTTFIGPTVPAGIAVDNEDNVYIVGTATTGGFSATPGAFQSACKSSNPGDGDPCYSATVTKLNSSSLIYSTFLDGTEPPNEYSPYPPGPSGIAVDAAGDAYIAGSTYAADFPVTSGAFQKTSASSFGQAYVAELNPTGTGLVYSTYLGGSGGTSGEGIAVDSFGAAYVPGYGALPSAPITYQALSSPGSTFVAKVNAEGGTLAYLASLGDEFGASSYNRFNGIAVDSEGNAYVTGATSSTAWPVTANAFQKANNGAANDSYNSFITKINSSGTGLVYSTYLGGSGTPEDNENDPYGDAATSIAIDSEGNAYVTGLATSPNFPVTSDAFQSTLAPGNNGFASDIFVTKLNSEGSGLIYSTYFGGSEGTEPDASNGIAADSLGNAYITGTAYSIGFPTTPGAYMPGGDFVSKCAINGATTTTLTSNNNPQSVGEEVTFTATVTPVSGTGTPSGEVNFLVDGTSAFKTTLDGSGHAMFSTSTIPVGPHSITASYYGASSTYSGSNGVLTQTITGQVAAPTFPTPPGTYQYVPLYVQLETSTLGAAIYYTTNGTMPNTGSLLYNGQIVVSGTETIMAIAVESGDSASPVASGTFTIAPAAIVTTTTITSSANPSTQGEPVSFIATVTAASGPTPTGTVTFKHGSTVMGSSPLNPGGVATFTTSDLTLLGHTITAAYSGSATDAVSGASLTQTVEP